MPSVSILYKNKLDVTDKMSIVIPKVRDILDCEDDYYSLITTLTAMPYDLMVQLDDIGIDFTSINEWELFLLLFNSYKKAPCLRLVFGDFDIENYDVAANENNDYILINEETGDVIDRMVYEHMAWTIRQIHHLEKNLRQPGNEAAKKYLIERTRIKQRRAARRKRHSELEDLIVAMVNTEQFKYDYESVLDLTIYQFNASVSQIVRKMHYDNLMIGAYTGHVDMKDVSKDDLNWLTSPKK